MFQEAVTVLETNRQLARDNLAYDLYVLAMCYQQLQDHTRAAATLEEACQWHSRQSDTLTRRARLELDSFRVEAETTIRPVQR
jgi:hypothetical protein